MFTKSNLLGTLVGAISSIVFGTIFFGPLLDFFWNKHTKEIEGLYREEPKFFWFTLSMILMGFIVSTIYGKFRKKEHSFMGGFEIGAWSVAYFYFGLAVMFYANRVNMDLLGLLVQAILGLIMYGITGGLIALVYKAVDKKK